MSVCPPMSRDGLESSTIANLDCGLVSEVLVVHTLLQMHGNVLVKLGHVEHV